MAAHLALVNVWSALRADKDPMPKKNAKAPSDGEISKFNRALLEQQQGISEMVSSPLEYARRTGYGELFGLEPMEQPKPEKTNKEKAKEAWETARRVLKRVMGGNAEEPEE